MTISFTWKLVFYIYICKKVFKENNLKRRGGVGGGGGGVRGALIRAFPWGGLCQGGLSPGFYSTSTVF